MRRSSTANEVSGSGHGRGQVREWEGTQEAEAGGRRARGREGGGGVRGREGWGGIRGGAGWTGGRGGGRRPTPLNDFLPQCPEELQPLLRVPPPLAAAPIPLVHLQRLQPLGELDLELQRVAAEAPPVAACAVPATAAAAAAAATGC